MFKSDEPKPPAWEHWIPAAVIVGFATAIGTKLGEWVVEAVRERLSSDKARP